MAAIRETQITDKRFEIGLSDDDPPTYNATVVATTRDNDGNVVVTYRNDVTAMVSAEDMVALMPLLQRGIQRIMEDRNITQADLEEGRQAREERGQLKAQEEQEMQDRIEARLEQERLEREEARARHFQELEELLEQQREGERRILEETEVREAAFASATYAQDVQHAIEERRRIDAIKAPPEGSAVPVAGRPGRRMSRRQVR